MGYYLWAYPSPAHFDPNSPGVYNWVGGKYAMSAMLASAKVYATQHERIFFIQAVLNHGSSNGHDIMAWLKQHYTLVAQYSSTLNKNYPRTVMVQLYARRAHSPVRQGLMRGATGAVPLIQRHARWVGPFLFPTSGCQWRGSQLASITVPELHWHERLGCGRWPLLHGRERANVCPSLSVRRHAGQHHQITPDHARSRQIMPDHGW